MTHKKSIAIVGIGGMFPNSPILDHFWENIISNVNTSREPPKGRWLLPPEEFYDHRVGTVDKIYSKKACFLDDETYTNSISSLDIDPDIFWGLDPMFRLLLQVGHQTVSDCKSNNIEKNRAGIIVGNLALPTEKASTLARRFLGRLFIEKLSEQNLSLDAPSVAPINHYVTGLPAGILAKALGFQGTCYTIDAACASSLYAIKLAMDELVSGRADIMLAGGLSRPDSLYTQMGFSQLRALSPTGTCSPFDRNSNGLVVGEGCGLILLKRTQDALKDEDYIYATIKGVGLSNDLGGDLLAPASEGQLRAMQSAYEQAGWSPHDVDLIECHATGTPVGDTVEFSSLRNLWKSTGWQPGQCVIGSVKANIGHLLTAAGAAALIKTLLALKNQTLPSMANFSEPAESIDLENSPFRILKQSEQWNVRRDDIPRKAAVSAFGFGGINAHLLLEEWLPVKSSKSPIKRHSEKRVKGQSIAIVGMGTHFGSWKNLEQYQHRVLGGLDNHLPAQPISWWGADQSRWYKNIGLTSAPFKGYFIPDVSSTPGEFKIPPKEQEEMLPRQLLMLKVAAEALNNAALTKKDLLNTGVYVGCGLDLNATNFSFRWGLQRTAQKWATELGLQLDEQEFKRWLAELRIIAGPPLTANRTMGALGSAVASRIAKEFRIGGPSFTLSSEDNSGLRALEIGIHSLQEGSINRAIVGAVDLAGDLRSVLCRHASNPFLPNDISSPFDLDVKREIIGEGAAAVVLKRLEDARQDNDRIYAVINGIGTAIDGKVEASRPNSQAYLLSMKRACENADVDEQTIDYLENCNFAKLDNDSMESQILTVTFGQNIKNPSCKIGSVKADIGNTGGTAGLASLVKTALCLYYRLLPSERNTQLLSCEYTGSKRKLEAPEEPRHWVKHQDDRPRRAIVSGMGSDGSCSHIVLEENIGKHDATHADTSNLMDELARELPVSHSILENKVCAHDRQEPGIHTVIGGNAFKPALPATTKAVDQKTTTEQEKNRSGNEKTLDSQVLQLKNILLSNIKAHEAYLRFSKDMEQAMSKTLSLQLSILQKSVNRGEDISGINHEQQEAELPGTYKADQFAAIEENEDDRVVAFDREMCLEFAIGSVEKMLGPDFAEVDTYPTRVRLPNEPLMLVDRIIEVEGVPHSLTQGRVVTEHDVFSDRWYLDGGRVPTSITVEAGQADLFLSGYLGIDAKTKGKAVYRLLDAEVTFHRGLPVAGEIIRYDIKIEKFFRQDQTYLFHFNFEGTINGTPLLSMRNGCAGFFTEEELAKGRGIVQTKLDLIPQPGILPENWKELVPMHVESYNEKQITALYDGNLDACFGKLFAQLPLNQPYTLPGGKLKLVDRVVELNPKGGRYGIGQIKAEMDIHPNDWFLTCHFVDDRVMPGTLMYECCMHTLRIYLLRMGWVGEEGQTWCEPVPGVASGLKCRGQVVETTKTVTYQVTIKEMGYRPEPFAIVDALMFADGHPIVDIPDMSIRLAGLDRHKIESMWRAIVQKSTDLQPKQILFDRDRITAFAIGKPSVAFGEPYKIFDQKRKIARFPGPPFQFLDRITAIKGDPWNMIVGATAEAEYDIPRDAWYFSAGRQTNMPFGILLEVGLQPCGWLAAYMGSALTSPEDLSFRNLDGNAIQIRPITIKSGTLTTHVKITRIASSGGMIIQGYDFVINDRYGPVYRGDTVFGFFTGESLAHQVGVQGASLYQPGKEELIHSDQFSYPGNVPYPKQMLRMIDNIEVFNPNGGPHRLGFIRGSKKVDPQEWFFKAHFYQDPVFPGSLGLESFLQLLKVVAVKRWGYNSSNQFEAVVTGEKHSWNYRGQIIPDNKEVQVEAVITAINDTKQSLKADGYLSVDGKIIYHLKDFSLALTNTKSDF